MVIATNIDRTPTEAERREMTIVGEATLVNIFRDKLAKKEQEFVKQHLPFDGQCAKADYEDEIEDIQRESVRIYGFVREQDLNKVNIELDKYGDVDRLEIVNDDEETELVNVNGLRSTVKVGHTIKYRCKQRGHGISVFMPTVVYEERFGEKVEKDKEEK